MEKFERDLWWEGSDPINLIWATFSYKLDYPIFVG